MIDFILREYDERKDDTILAIVPEPMALLALLGYWGQQWPGVKIFKVEVRIDGNAGDVAIVELAGDRRYAIYGTAPRPSNSDAELHKAMYVDGEDEVVTAICNRLQQFYAEGRFSDPADLVGLRAIPV